MYQLKVTTAQTTNKIPNQMNYVRKKETKQRESERKRTIYCEVFVKFSIKLKIR